ncbi:MAG: class I SAM-dependent methyltransferase [Phycisphaerae bacterium]|nr:class I SAM-dependent methyltransferase [Phycisphaerae bacterium]
MVGMARLENVEACLKQVLADGVAGDCIETGVWRGGCTIFMRGLLKAYGVTDRTVWVADSFAGVPKPSCPEDEGTDLYLDTKLAVSEERVREHFRRFDLLDDQVRFLPGWFEDTTPTAPIERLALLRLDGDLYSSTVVVLRHLYDKVSPGGYIIIDDYGALEPCRRAVDEFRTERGIAEPMHTVDWTCTYWRKPLTGRTRCDATVTRT